MRCLLFAMLVAWLPGCTTVGHFKPLDSYIRSTLEHVENGVAGTKFQLEDKDPVTITVSGVFVAELSAGGSLAGVDLSGKLSTSDTRTVVVKLTPGAGGLAAAPTTEASTPPSMAPQGLKGVYKLSSDGTLTVE